MTADAPTSAVAAEIEVLHIAQIALAWRESAMRVLAFVATIMAACVGAATAQERLGLDCDWISSEDISTGRSSPTTGSAFYLLTFLNPKGGTAQKQGLGAEFIFMADEIEFVGQTAYKIAGSDIAEEFQINRYTGKIRSVYKIGTGALIHHGQCKIMQRRQF